MSMPWIGATPNRSGQKWFPESTGGSNPPPSAGQVHWWDGTDRVLANVLGWWDGTDIQPVNVLGWWDGTDIQSTV